MTPLSNKALVTQKIEACVRMNLVDTRLEKAEQVKRYKLFFEVTGAFLFKIDWHIHIPI